MLKYLHPVDETDDEESINGKLTEIRKTYDTSSKLSATNTDWRSVSKKWEYELVHALTQNANLKEELKIKSKQVSGRKLAQNDALTGSAGTGRVKSKIRGTGPKIRGTGPEKSDAGENYERVV